MAYQLHDPGYVFRQHAHPANLKGIRDGCDKSLPSQSPVQRSMLEYLDGGSHPHAAIPLAEYPPCLGVIHDDAERMLDRIRDRCRLAVIESFVGCPRDELLECNLSGVAETNDLDKPGLPQFCQKIGVGASVPASILQFPCHHIDDDDALRQRGQNLRRALRGVQIDDGTGIGDDATGRVTQVR